MNKYSPLSEDFLPPENTENINFLHKKTTGGWLQPGSKKYRSKSLIVSSRF
jgi:hypothetical protein